MRDMGEGTGERDQPYEGPLLPILGRTSALREQRPLVGSSAVTRTRVPGAYDCSWPVACTLVEFLDGGDECARVGAEMDGHQGILAGSGGHDSSRRDDAFATATDHAIAVVEVPLDGT